MRTAAAELLPAATPGPHPRGPVGGMGPRRRGTRRGARALGGLVTWPDEVRAAVAAMDGAARARILADYAGDRSDRRYKPGRALEATTYTFEVICDYGAYRDLQRHRMLTLQAQPLGVALGWDMPDEVDDAGCGMRTAPSCPRVPRSTGSLPRRFRSPRRMRSASPTGSGS